MWCQLEPICAFWLDWNFSHDICKDDLFNLMSIRNKFNVQEKSAVIIFRLSQVFQKQTLYPQCHLVSRWFISNLNLAWCHFNCLYCFQTKCFICLKTDWSTINQRIQIPAIYDEPFISVDLGWIFHPLTSKRDIASNPFLVPCKFLAMYDHMKFWCL